MNPIDWPSEQGIFSMCPCLTDERVCWGDGKPIDYTYMYEHVFKRLGVCLPLTDFEGEVLCGLNVAPTQPHSNC